LRFARWPWRAGGGDGDGNDNGNGNGNAPPARHRPGQCTAVEERTGVPLYLLLPDTLTTVRQCDSATVQQYDRKYDTASMYDAPSTKYEARVRECSRKRDQHQRRNGGTAHCTALHCTADCSSSSQSKAPQILTRTRRQNWLLPGRWAAVCSLQPARRFELSTAAQHSTYSAQTEPALLN